MSGSVVKFGTDGVAGIIADDFTYANVRVAAAAIANYVLAERIGGGRVYRWDNAVRLTVVCGAWWRRSLSTRGFRW